MTFSEILLDVYDRTGNSQAPPAEVSRRIKRFVNRWNRKILTSKGMDGLRRISLTKASVAAQAEYGIVAMAIRLVSEPTTQRKLTEKTLDWYRTRFPRPASFSSTPEWYVSLGRTRYHTKPSAPAELFIVSSSAADTGVVKIEAIRSNGYRVSLSKALAGLVPVSLDATITDVIDLVDVYVSATQAGVVTVTEGNAGAELSRISIGQTVPRFTRFALAPMPSAAITYTIDGIADVVDLVNDTDEPFASPDFHDLLVDGAVHDEWKNRGRGKEAADLRAEIESRIRALRASILEWDYGFNDVRSRTFDETIHLPIT